MAHESWDSIDNKSNTFTDIYCAFIDILGYKDKSKKFFDGAFNLYGRVERALQTMNYIKNVSSVLTDLSEMKTQYFSDSIIVTIPKKQYNLEKLLQFTTTLAANLSFEDLFVRGGISAGKHFDVMTKSNSQFLASEALQQAYILESENAVNPRILIDPALMDGLKLLDDNIIIKEKSEYIAHYAQVLINRNGDNPHDVIAEMIDIENAMMKSTVESVKSKYQWVLDYYYWTVCTSKNFDTQKFKKFSSGIDRGFEKRT